MVFLYVCVCIVGVYVILGRSFYSFKYATFRLTYSFKGLIEIPFAIVIVKDAFATRACT